MRATMSDVYLTEEEVAARYKISNRSLQRWRYTGNGGPPFVRLGLRRIGYRLSDCEAWAAANTHHSFAAELAVRAAG
jgi:predicted DNA-binding transcriptional regulator AlpA